MWITLKSTMAWRRYCRSIFFVPGCSPHPLTILDGLLALLGRVSG